MADKENAASYCLKSILHYPETKKQFTGPITKQSQIKTVSKTAVSCENIQDT
jgi:hypothetical protein